ncbi:MAG: DNA polymerase/3'-5' exonuclease PolX [Gemmatimonadetes bacterium]|nr:DNA polymerase/3'-5' exonuclease PolX [Gemmatimonadota bacterium]
MDKHAAAHVLEQIASFLDLKGDNEFKVRAFRNAARAVETLSGDFAHAVASGALGDVKGVGPATLEVVREAVLTGRSSVLETLRRDVPPGLVEMLRISGLGVSKIRALHDRLGISTVAELEVAARDGRLARLPRFGEKTAEKILKGIEFLRRTGEYRLFHHALRQAEQLCRGILALPGVAAAEVAGSVRRRCEIIRDFDLAVAGTAAPQEISERLAAFSGVRDVVGVGDAAFTVHFEDGVAADIYYGAPDAFGHLLAWTTGSARHLELLAAHAARHGFTLDAGGLRKDGAAIPCPDEATLYRSLGLAWVPPELREGGDEVSRAAAGKLPRLVERGDLVGFIHCHTVYSDGTNTVAELAEACRAAGYRYLGITDHSVAAAYAGGLTEETIARQHAEIDAVNRATSDIRVLKGIEADILVDGALDYGPEFLDRFDFVIGSIHSRMELDQPTMTRRVLKAIDDPHLAIVGHPTGRLLLAREAYPIDMDAVITRAAERGVAIEINADPQRLDLDWRRCAGARDAGVPISIGADAHSIAGIANVDVGIGIARKGWLQARDILNTREVAGFLEHAEARKGR